MAVKQELSHTLWIAWKDLVELERSKARLILLLLMPFIMMTLISSIFPSQNALSNVAVAVVNSDTGPYGSQLLAQLENMSRENEWMVFVNTPSFDEAKEMIKSGNAMGAIVIPEDFSETLASRQQTANITVMTDDSNPQVSTAMSSFLGQVISMMSQKQAAMDVYPYAQSIKVNPIAIVVPYRAKSEGVVGRTMSYVEFMVPGIMMMVMISSVMTGLPRAIAYERDIGTLDGFLVAPISRLSLVTGKVLARVATGMLQGIVTLILAIIVFGVSVDAVILPSVLLVLLLGVFSFVGLGILLTSIAEDEQTAMMIMMTLMLPMMFLSGIFFPIQLMPNFMQTIAYSLPFTYAVGAVRAIMIFGANLGAVAMDMFILIGFGSVMLLLAVPVFNRAMTR
jgi:ABC-2 type transport system permease protein